MSWYVSDDYFLRKTPQAVKGQIDLYDVGTDKAWEMLKNGMMNKKAFEAWFNIHGSIHKPVRDDIYIKALKPMSAKGVEAESIETKDVETKDVETNLEA